MVQQRQYDVMLYRFPYGQHELPQFTDWNTLFMMQCLESEWVRNVWSEWADGTPITMLRNKAVLKAIEKGADILVMIDSDNIPHNDFWMRALACIDARWDQTPTVYASPYCGPPPHENVYVFRWENYTSNDPNPRYRITQYSRDEASRTHNVVPVAALPTGCCAIDMRIFTGFKGVKLPTPWFAYEWADEYHSEKLSTEDVVWSRNVSALFQMELGVEVCLVDFDCWALHRKAKLVDRPMQATPEHIMQMVKDYHEQNDDNKGDLPILESLDVQGSW